MDNLVSREIHVSFDWNVNHLYNVCSSISFAHIIHLFKYVFYLFICTFVLFLFVYLFVLFIYLFVCIQLFIYYSF